MSNCETGLANANEEELFAIIEDSCGTLKVPTATDRMYSVGPIDFAQEQEFLDDEQIRASASRTSPIKGRKPPGDLSFTTYVKPSGVAGTPPEHAALFQALMGAESTLDPTFVDYTLANNLDSLSVWSKKGHSVFCFRGLTINTATFTIEGASIAQIAWGANYMEQLWCGTGIADGNIGAGVTSIPLKPPQATRYRVGTRISIGTSMPWPAAGHLITNINYETDTLTVSPGVVGAQGIDPDIVPWWPTSAAEEGAPVHGKVGMVTIDLANCVVLSAEITVNNNIKYYVDEKNNLWTAEQFGRPGKREIDGNLSLYFLKPGPSYFYRAEWQKSDSLVIPAGNVSGKIMELTIPNAEYRTPKLSGDEEFIEDIPFIAVGTGALNNELSIRFK